MADRQSAVEGMELMREKCLLLFPRPLYPQLSGYAMKSKNLVLILSEKYDLTVALLSDHGIDTDEQEFYRSVHAKWICFRIPKWRSYLHCFLGLFSRRPLQVSYYYSRTFQKKVDELSENADVLISVLVRTRQYFMGKEKEKPVIFDMTDSIALNYERSRRNTKSFFWRMIYGVEGKRLERYERECIEKSAVTYLLNRKEYEYWSPFGNVRLLPHGVNEVLRGYDRKDSRFSGSVVFMGKMDYQPNVDAALWYMKNVQPLTGKRIPLLIVGANPARELYAAAASAGNTTITGFVDDPYVYAASSLAVIAPMQTGGGIQNKVLEGMALGKVNIVTSLAAEPITEAKDGVNLLVAGRPEEYVRILNDMADHAGTRDETDMKYKRIGSAASELIWGKYTWKTYGEAFIKGIEETGRKEADA